MHTTESRAEAACSAARQKIHTCSMNCGMILWKVEPLKCNGLPFLPMPFSPAQSLHVSLPRRCSYSASSSLLAALSPVYTCQAVAQRTLLASRGGASRERTGAERPEVLHSPRGLLAVQTKHDAACVHHSTCQCGLACRTTLTATGLCMQESKQEIWPLRSSPADFPPIEMSKNTCRNSQCL
jgi:hypothetical protein